MFYVAPLLCIALLAWVERDAPRPRLLAVVAAGVSALLVVAIPLERFITTSALTDTLMLLPFWSLQDRIGAGWTEVAALALAVALAAAFLFVPRRYALALPLLVLGIWIAATRPIWWGTHGFERFSSGALFQGIRTVDRDWVDRTLPSGERAAFLWTRAHRPAHRQPERVLQSRRRPGLLRHRPDPRRLARERGADRSADGRGDVPGRDTGARPIPPRGLLVRAGRRATCDRRGMGDHALACARAARLGGPCRRLVSRTTRGRERRSRTRAGAADRARSRLCFRATRAFSPSRRRSSRARRGGSSAGRR